MTTKDARVETPEGNSLACDSIGAGEPVILLHGAGQTRHAWARTAAALADAGYRAITFDARGHGDSDWTDAYGIPPNVTDLRAVVAQLCPPGARPAIIGASMGGLTGIAALGGDNPLPASSLVLVDIAPRFQREGTGPILDFMAANPNGFASVEEAADAVARYMTDRPRPRNAAGLRKNLRLKNGRYHWHWDPAFMDPAVNRDFGNRRFDLDAASARIAVPVMLVYGEHSKVVNAQSVAHLRALLPDAETARVEGAGHMVAGDANNPFTENILGFLESHYPAEAPSRGAGAVSR
ncbi:alpha/beta fold hydrolase [Aurantiacibacter spongiae]|uniref:Alpha/beta hydrolase n=1 Tax=Aurantiacibacter spongiae TaxID=2488860 RepID=A0A3N5CTZ2_9SPHN|nr:alpha/beta hydrolase [Aurantiacibacter spongiae]RPF71786.1 alpha/beta hydrolase [Aurantiacibacter spongiae]